MNEAVVALIGRRGGTVLADLRKNGARDAGGKGPRSSKSPTTMVGDSEPTLQMLLGTRAAADQRKKASHEGGPFLYAVPVLGRERWNRGAPCEAALTLL